MLRRPPTKKVYQPIPDDPVPYKSPDEYHITMVSGVLGYNISGQIPFTPSSVTSALTWKFPCRRRTHPWSVSE